VLLNPAVQAAVIENGARSILSEGLAYDRCQVGVVTNLDPAELFPDFYIDELEQVVKVYRTQVDVVLPSGTAVLNADDDQVAAMAPLCDGKVTLFGMSGASPVIAAHRGQGGRAVFVQDDHIVLAEGPAETLLLSLAAVPSMAEGVDLAFQTQNILAALGAAWALDIDLEFMRAGIESFEREPIAALASNATPPLAATA
jgi:cyanophycin synthetase